MYSHLFVGIILQVNQTAQNESKAINQEELAQMIFEMESMLRDMRFKTFDFQKRLAENELDQANNCEFKILFFVFTISY